MKTRLVLYTSALAIGAMTTAPVFAQELTPMSSTAGTQDDSGAGLGDIIVTANKRAERLQDVPISVTAITNDVLERENVRELDDVTKLVPGLTINYGSQPGNFSINMRGIGTFSNGIAVESDVAVVIDDVPVGFQAAAFKDLIDVERVEALRGPQSTLFGKSAIAGVLNITTMAPSTDFSGRATALFTDDNEWRVGGTVSGPISNTLRFRLTASKSNYEGPIKNLSTGKNLNGTDGFTLTGKLLWAPTDNFEITVQPRYNKTNSLCCVSAVTSLNSTTAAPLFYQNIPQLPQSLVQAGINIGPYNRTVRNDVRAGGRSRTYGATAKLSFTFDPDSFLGDANLMSISSFDNWRMIDYQDVDGTDSPFLRYFPLNNPSGLNQGTELHGVFHAKSRTQELRLTSPTGKFQYVAGLWYAHNDLDRLLDRGPIQNPVKYLAVSTNTNYAAFAQATWNVFGPLTLIGGIRANRQEIDYKFYKYSTNEFFSQADSDNHVTGKVGAQYNFTPDIMAYATYSTGYKGQAYDLVSTFNAAIAGKMPVPPETAKNYEIGFKSSLFDRRLYFNTTLFSADFYGFQTSITTVRPDDGLFITTLNSVGHLRTRGIETDFIARITPNFRLNGAGAYMEAKVVRFPNGPCFPRQAQSPDPAVAAACRPDPSFPPGPPAPPNVQDLAGKRLNNAPKFKFNLGGQYDIDMPQMPFDAFITFAYRWQSKINFALSQDPITVQKAYGIFNGSIGVASHDDKLKVTLFANNLFNKHYASGLGNTASGFVSSNGGVVTGTSWQPARDSFRYLGTRVDLNF